MTRTKNRTGKPAATSAAHAALPASPRPGTSPAAGGALEAVRAALAASNGDGAATATIAAAAKVSRAAASKALTTLETAGTARREKGTGRGAPDTWHPVPAPPPASSTAADPGSDPAAAPPGPGSTPAEPADTTPAPGSTDGTAEPATPPADDAPAAPPPPDPAVLAGITENASQVTVAAAAVTTALETGDFTAARHAIEEIRDQAAAALRAVKAAVGGRTGTGARPGQLRELVAAHLAAHPDKEFTPHEIGKALTRSSGAVANALDKLVSLGQATLACEKPRRYRHAGPATAPAAGDEALAGAA